MVNEIVLTLVGNLTADPELRHTQNGRPVAGFSVACTPRRFDRESGEWLDGDTTFMRCSVWGDYAENVAATLSKGSRVIVKGALSQNNYETKDGEKRVSYEVVVDEIGPSLRYARADLHRIIKEDWTPSPADAPKGKRAAEPAMAGADNGGAPF